jgi:hypothetical protein
MLDNSSDDTGRIRAADTIVQLFYAEFSLLVLDAVVGVQAVRQHNRKAVFPEGRYICSGRQAGKQAGSSRGLRSNAY